MNIRNEFLLKIGIEARKGRKRFWDTNQYCIRLSENHGNIEGGLWFKTQGCSYDRLGGCIVCDYSSGDLTTAKNMIQYVQQGLDAISKECSQLLVSPSGSLLDEKEVPREALEEILTILNKSPHKSFSFETRADTINSSIIKRCNELLENKLYKVFIGLESCNPWILKYCLNKELNPTTFIESHKVLLRENIKTAANITLGAPFMSVDESIKSTIKTVNWAINEGVEECFIFPVHVKASTPLMYLHNDGLFSSPSLWSLVEVLKNLKSHIDQKRIRLSWYKSYGAYNIVASPTTCNKCINEVMSLFDKFASYGDFEIVEKLSNFDCICKQEWLKKLNFCESLSLPERVATGYELLANKLLGPLWWQNNSEKIISELLEDADSNIYKGQCF